jgi:iron complex transport system substrate-binding protein
LEYALNAAFNWRHFLFKQNTMKIKCLILIVSFCLIGCVTSCIGPNKDKSETKSIQSNSKSQLIKYSKYFQVVQIPNGYSLTIIEPKGQRQQQFILSTADSGIGMIKIPIQKLAVMSSMYGSMLAAIGEANRIVAIDNIHYQTEQSILDRYEQGKIKQVNVNQHLDVEAIIKLKPDLIIDYSNYYQSGNQPSALVKANIKTVLFHDYLETSPLARAEWIKVVGLLCNKFELVDSIFNSIESEYNQYKRLASIIKNRKNVFCETEFNGTWYVPAGNSYISNIIKDAGANYVFGNDTNSGSIPYPFETVYSKAKTADVWINVGEIHTKLELLNRNKKYNWFKAFKTNEVYNNNKMLNVHEGNAIWNRGTIEPHIVLKDLIKIFYPELVPNDSLKYYKRLN